MERTCGVGLSEGATRRLSRKGVAVLALSAVLVLAGAIPVLAGTASGNVSYFTCGRYGYRNWATVATSSSGATAGTVIGSYPSVTRPTGWYGAQGRLYNSNGDLVKWTDMVYSGSAANGMAMWTAAYPVHGNYYSYGLSKSWFGSGYHGHATYKSPLQTY